MNPQVALLKIAPQGVCIYDSQKLFKRLLSNPFSAPVVIDLLNVKTEGKAHHSLFKENKVQGNYMISVTAR